MEVKVDTQQAENWETSQMPAPGLANWLHLSPPAIFYTPSL